MTLPSDAQQRNAGDIDKTLCEEALRIVQGNRREKYDIPERNFHRVALAWQSITDRAYTAQEIALMFVALKLVRQSHAAQRDNIVDGIGYLLCADAVTEKPAESFSSHSAATPFKEQWTPLDHNATDHVRQECYACKYL